MQRLRGSCVATASTFNIMSSLQPYQGPVRKLVVAMDVGTTYSGVAFAVLDPGEVPKISGVTR